MVPEYSKKLKLEPKSTISIEWDGLLFIVSKEEFEMAIMRHSVGCWFSAVCHDHEILLQLH